MHFHRRKNGFLRLFAHKKTPSPHLRDEVTSRYNPDSRTTCPDTHSCCNVQSRRHLLLVRSRSSGANLGKVLNLRRFTADGLLSLKEKLFLLTPSRLLPFHILATDARSVKREGDANLLLIETDGAGLLRTLSPEANRL